ncbi:uncharacterized protein [Garra rufa]|uniref:uncharacterized protein n=1 Tax=Garra rufa TaxID=137080 RepID=UPI003CCEBE8F
MDRTIDDFKKKLNKSGLKETSSHDGCNVILVFCPIVSRAGTDIDAALNELNTCSVSKPAIFMVFHHTFEAEKFVPDSSRVINRRNTLTVDCLFHEDKGLLKCSKNEEALTKIVHHLKPQEQKKFNRFVIFFAIFCSSCVCYKLIQLGVTQRAAGAEEGKERKMNQYQVHEVDPFKPTEGKHYFIIEMGKSSILQKQISEHLQKHWPAVKEVQSVDYCNVILVFCIIVSRAGTDIDAALNKLNTCSASKPAIFMVFHHTFDLNKPVPDSSRHVSRENTLTVDCLFNEDVGLLTCDMNKKALTKLVQCFKNQESCLDILLMYACCLCCCCCWIFRELKTKILKHIRGQGRGTCESGTNDENRRLLDEDEGKNV